MATGRVVGLEALLRWRHPVRGLQNPWSVAEAFKDYELASKIGGLMQSKVLADLRDWKDAGLQVGRVSVNAAPVEFLRDDYAERLLEKIASAGLSPACLEVEVTEQVFYERGVAFVERALQTLASAGVTIALDDFGTGYSSLSHLRDFPVHVVKIDRSFITGIAADPEIAAIVSAIAGLAHCLGLQVVAEGVETTEQKDGAMAAGCTFGQGNLFGESVAPDVARLIFSGAAQANAA